MTDLCPTCGGGVWPGSQETTCPNNFHGKPDIRPRADGRVFYVVTHDTGDGMEPDVQLARTLAGIKFIALELLNYHNDVREFECPECGPVEVTRPDGNWAEPATCSDCDSEMEVVDDDLDESRDAVKAWNGEEPLTVDYFDGNMGHMTLGTTHAP